MGTLALILITLAIGGFVGAYRAGRHAASLVPPPRRLPGGGHGPEFDRLVSTLRHDLRGILAPALLAMERLEQNPDPSVRRAGEIVTESIERAVARLAETRNRPTSADSAHAPPPEGGRPAAAEAPGAPAPPGPPAGSPPPA